MKLSASSARQWIESNFDDKRQIKLDPDYGLSAIALYLGQSDALSLYWSGAALECRGEVDEAIRLYKRAFLKWPALDSIVDGGIPRGVREEAIMMRCPVRLLTSVDVSAARMSRVMMCKGLLESSDFVMIEALRRNILETQTIYENNPQNCTHQGKQCLFMNEPPTFLMLNTIPLTLAKLLRFTRDVWLEAGWGGVGGVLADVSGGFSSLSVRVAEHWTYNENGGLNDSYHYDTDSIVTIVALLSSADTFSGGVFRTNESDGQLLEYAMDQGDVICFVSHKYHNVTPVLSGIRRSLVLELWQGGCDHEGR